MGDAAPRIKGCACGEAEAVVCLLSTSSIAGTGASKETEIKRGGIAAVE